MRPMLRRRVEGVAFGVPISDALKALGLSSGADTAPGLLSAPAAQLSTSIEAPVVLDDADGEVSLEPAPPPPVPPPAEDRLRARQVARDKATPQSVKTIRTLGWVGLVSGAAVGVYTFQQFKGSTPTRSEYSSLRTVNAVGWGVALTGLGAVIYGYAARPALADDVPPAPKTSLSIGPGSIELQGSF